MSLAVPHALRVPLAKGSFFKPQVIPFLCAFSMVYGIFRTKGLSTPANCRSFDLGPLPILGWRFPRCRLLGPFVRGTTISR